MKDITCCFTGHRQLPSELSDLEKRLTETVTSLVSDGYVKFVAGGAIGFDTLAAQVVLKLKAEFSQISLHLVLPCKEQDKYWTDGQKKEYAKLLGLADSHEYVCESYTRYCMHQRNKRMVDMSSCVIAFFNGDAKGGTASTVKYANQKSVKVINLF